MSSSPTALQAALADCGLVAILRGLRPAEAQAVGRVLHDAGFRLIEVPLNSPDPLGSIRILRDSLPAGCLVGAGTVIDPAACAEIRAAGGQIVVMPHSDAAVIRAAKAAGLFCTPGVTTPTEAYAALAAGADALKMFPAEQLGVPALKAWRAVLRPPVGLIPVGGIVPESIAAYAAAGATGFGLGSALYQPGRSAADVGERARAFVAAWRAAYPRAATPSETSA
ncbi:2-dehydro-3-deoxy-6-phosphogalactonate aldolase [Xylophilus sp.]|uniref:2-dehydro-3-deoxy-6-phosphogalactonate aldolase n=1 Tax=Xylophilus sp. TaxID=2653893 RepID=UPI0013B5F944|nr:2-dehydro-3-deoxy-6-phosphogalactonate aldolase [Xylophilus sp.]KAF1048348.1 MAG: 2-dehydro-3-deoxy-6-phosphogalactonate aldolase [Xylophilus sp.]